jgi:hypothetical protein
VYIVNEAGLMIVDASDPFNPHLSSFLQIQEPPGPGRVSTTDGVAVRDNYVYVAASGGGLKVVDVSQPTNPHIVAECSWTDNVIYDVKLSGNYAYLVDWGGGNSLAICDISDPLHPIHRSSLPVTDAVATTIQRLVVHDPWVYLADGSQGIAWVDISNPVTPTLAGHIDTVGYANDLFTVNGRVFVADDEGGLVIYSETALHAVSSSVPNSPPLHQAVRQSTTNKVHSITPELPLSQPTAWTKTAEISEPATIAATCTVTNTADSGSGTLRECMQNARSGTTINFNPAVFPPAHPVTISITSAELPRLCWGYETIDASNAGVILDGSQAPADAVGLSMGSSHNTIKGLQIVNFPQAGIIFGGTSTNNQIGGDRTQGSGPIGEGNLVSGNHGPAGIQIATAESSNNIFQGNLVGVDVSGTQAFPNNIGMLIGSSSNLIGGNQPGERNIVSGNWADGITLHSASSTRNLVLNNYAGVDISGQHAIPNGTFGVGMDLGANNNRVENNVIVPALLFYDWGSSYNVVVGNRINTDASGSVALGGTTGYAITIGGGAGFNRIGGKTPAERNIIVGQVALFHKPEIGNLILGNYLGTNASGLQTLSTVGPGIGLSDSRYVFIGGNTPGEANLIGSQAGINLNPGVSDIFILGNIIGPDANGGSTLQHDYGGLWLNGSTHTFIQRNTIANFDGPAAQIELAGPNTLRQNSIYSNSQTTVQPAILLQDGGNDNLAAPLLTLNSTGLTGTTCLSCTVEFFFDEANEGRVYMGSATADASGVFSHPQVCPLPYTHLTATTIDLAGNTSAFATPHIIPWDCSTANPVPTLSDLKPITITALSNTFLLTLQGTDFSNGSIARWNGLSLPTTVVSSTQLSAIVPSTRITAGGFISVTVSNPAPGGGTSNPLDFTIDNPVPALGGLVPSSIIVTSQGFTLTIAGSNFVNQSVARWNGTDLTTTFLGDTQLLADVPTDYLSDAGNVAVSIFNPAPGGGTSETATFIILPFKKVYLPIVLK